MELNMSSKTKPQPRHTHGPLKGRYKSDLEEKRPYRPMLTKFEYEFIKAIRVLKKDFPTIPALDNSFEQDLYFLGKLEIMLASIESCQGDDCNKQAKFLVLSIKENYCERCLKKKEYFRV